MALIENRHKGYGFGADGMDGTGYGDGTTFYGDGCGDGNSGAEGHTHHSHLSQHGPPYEVVDLITLLARIDRGRRLE